MSLEIGNDGTIQEQAPAGFGIKFRNRESGQEMITLVHDKFPTMGDVHIEGRRYVEVSVEMFVSLLSAVGFDAVDPHEGEEDTVVAHEDEEGEDA